MNFLARISPLVHVHGDFAVLPQATPPNALFLATAISPLILCARTLERLCHGDFAVVACASLGKASAKDDLKKWQQKTAGAFDRTQRTPEPYHSVLFTRAKHFEEINCNGPHGDFAVPVEIVSLMFLPATAISPLAPLTDCVLTSSAPRPERKCAPKRRHEQQR